MLPSEVLNVTELTRSSLTAVTNSLVASVSTVSEEESGLWPVEKAKYATIATMMSSVTRKLRWFCGPRLSPPGVGSLSSGLLSDTKTSPCDCFPRPGRY